MVSYCKRSGEGGWIEVGTVGHGAYTVPPTYEASWADARSACDAMSILADATGGTINYSAVDGYCLQRGGRVNTAESLAGATRLRLGYKKDQLSVPSIDWQILYSDTAPTTGADYLGWTKLLDIRTTGIGRPGVQSFIDASAALSLGSPTIYFASLATADVNGFGWPTDPATSGTLVLGTLYAEF